MFKFVAKTVQTQDNFKELFSDLNTLANSSVFVGVPDTKTERKADTPINNAELAYLHEHGAPEQNLPKREFLQPAIDANLDKINVQQEKILKAGLESNTSQLTIELNKLGLLSQSLVKNWFTIANNGWEPLKPATIKRKKSSKPLIDTGQLLNSINYVVKQND